MYVYSQKIAQYSTTRFSFASVGVAVSKFANFFVVGSMHTHRKLCSVELVLWAEIDV